MNLIPPFAVLWLPRGGHRKLYLKLQKKTPNLSALHIIIKGKFPKNTWFMALIQLTWRKHDGSFKEARASVLLACRQAAQASPWRSRHTDPLCITVHSSCSPWFPSTKWVSRCHAQHPHLKVSPFPLPPPNLLALSVAFHLPAHCYSCTSQDAACSTQMKQVNTQQTIRGQ